MLCKATIPAHVPLSAAAGSTILAVCCTASSEATAARLTASGRADAPFAARTGRLGTLFAAILTASRAATMTVGIGAVGIEQEQPVDYGAAACRSQNSDSKQAGRKVSHGFYPGRFRPSGPS